ncbi:MAG: glycosyltransferase, partial [Bacteroidetes bacterium]
LFKRTATRLFYRLFQRLADVDAPLDTGDFRLVSRAVLDEYRRIQEQQPYVRGLIAWLGFNQTGIEYVRPGRAAGQTKYPFRKLLQLAVDGITAFSDRPLRYAARLGLVASALSMLGLVWVVIAKLVYGIPVSGWASLMVTLFLFGGLQLFFLGVLGSYLARVFAEVRRRPRYIIRESWHSDADAGVPVPASSRPTAR